MGEEKYKIVKSIVYDTLDDETGVVIDSANNMSYEVTSSVCFILQLLKTPKTFENIKQKMLSEYDVDEETVETDLKKILSDLLKNKIIEKSL